MKQTIAEKILSAKAGSPLRAGDIAVCEVDAIMGTDGSVPMAIDYFEQLRRPHVPHPRRIVFALDHYTPASAQEKAWHLHARVREFAVRHGIEVWEQGEGVGHQLMVERGWVTPGALAVGADSHSVTYGAVNALGTGIGSSDLAVALASGKVWLKVPDSIRVNLHGALRPPVAAKDLALELLRRLGGDGANYCALEFAGEGVRSLDMSDRLVVCNMVVEMGAKAGIFPFDEITRAFLEAHASRQAWEPVAADERARYIRTLDVDLSALSPLVAQPHRPDNVAAMDELPGRVPVQMVYLGTCTGGRTKDFREALSVLRRAGGVAAGVQFVVTPASRSIQEELDASGELAEFKALGATIGTPGCGACCGTCGTIPADGHTVVSTANRNFIGRMGNPKAAIYLASPASCAAAAAAGYVTKPSGGAA